MEAVAAARDYSSGDWRAMEGSENEFIARWTEFLEWTRAAAPGLVGARLIQDPGDPRHFISFAEWESLATLEAWRKLPDFSVKLGACRALCESFHGANYTLVARVS